MTQSIVVIYSMLFGAENIVGRFCAMKLFHYILSFTFERLVQFEKQLMFIQYNLNLIYSSLNENLNFKVVRW